MLVAMSVIAKAIWYIESHLDSELSLEEIAWVSRVSRFHLSRGFVACTGISLGAYVRARRLSGAARALAAGAPDILGVALAAGYGSHEAFTRAFRQHFGLTPEQFRAQAPLEHPSYQEPFAMSQATKTEIAPPRLVDGEALLIVGISEHYRCEN